MTKDKKKLRAQVKSRFYYMFWGAATLSVFAGQMYVGTGYRKMSESFDKIVGTVILELDAKPYPRHHNNKQHLNKEHNNSRRDVGRAPGSGNFSGGEQNVYVKHLWCGVSTCNMCIVLFVY